MIAQAPTLEFVTFCLQAAPGVGASTLRAILARLARENLAPDDLWRLDDHVLLSRFGLNPAVVHALRNPDHETLETWQRLDEQLVKILVRGQPGYPERLLGLLGDSSPPILFLLGGLDLFQRKAVG